MNSARQDGPSSAITAGAVRLGDSDRTDCEGTNPDAVEVGSKSSTSVPRVAAMLGLARTSRAKSSPSSWVAGLFPGGLPKGYSAASTSMTCLMLLWPSAFCWSMPGQSGTSACSSSVAAPSSLAATGGNRPVGRDDADPERGTSLALCARCIPCDVCIGERSCGCEATELRRMWCVAPGEPPPGLAPGVEVRPILLRLVAIAGAPAGLWERTSAPEAPSCAGSIAPAAASGEGAVRGRERAIEGCERTRERIGRDAAPYRLAASSPEDPDPLRSASVTTGGVDLPTPASDRFAAFADDSVPDDGGARDVEDEDDALMLLGRSRSPTDWSAPLIAAPMGLAAPIPVPSEMWLDVGSVWRWCRSESDEWGRCGALSVPGEPACGWRGMGTQPAPVAGTGRALDGPVERRLLRAERAGLAESAAVPGARGSSSASRPGLRDVDGGIVADLRVGEGEGTSPIVPTARRGDAAAAVSTSRAFSCADMAGRGSDARQVLARAPGPTAVHV